MKAKLYETIELNIKLPGIPRVNLHELGEAQKRRQTGPDGLTLHMSDAVKAITWNDMGERERQRMASMREFIRFPSLTCARSRLTDNMTSQVNPFRGCACTMELVEYLDVSYLPSSPPNSFQTFDIYIPKQPLLDTPPGLICFIHGGAWRA